MLVSFVALASLSLVTSVPGETPTAQQTRRFRALEDEVLQELNLLRADPRAYAAHLRAMIDRFDGPLLRPPAGLPIRTTEGAAAVVEAVAALEGLGARPPLFAARTLAAAAADHVRDQGPTGDVGHRGTDGSNSRMRMSRHGIVEGVAAEVIDYGWREARDVVIDLLIDDGVRDRGHRVNILDPTFQLAGVACGTHEVYGIMCVVDMAEGHVPLVIPNLAHDDGAAWPSSTIQPEGRAFTSP